MIYNIAINPNDQLGPGDIIIYLNIELFIDRIQPVSMFQCAHSIGFIESLETSPHFPLVRVWCLGSQFLFSPVGTQILVYVWY